MINIVNPALTHVMRPYPQDATTAWALYPFPFYEKGADGASFGTFSIIAAPALLGSPVPLTDVLAGQLKPTA